MLGIMRKYKESIVIKVVFVVIVLSFIGTIFLVWGKGDQGSGGTRSYAAKVNGTKISLDDFQRSYYRLRGIYEQLYGRSLSPELEKQMGIRKMAMETLIESELIRQAARKMGISVSKDEISKAIAEVPAFQKDGASNFDQYLQILKSNRITPADFEESQKEDILIKKARQQIKDKATVSDDEARQSFAKRNDKLDLQFVSFSPAQLMGEVKLTDQDLTAHLQANQDKFKTPEQISIQYCMVDPATLAGKVTLGDDEIQTFYQKNIDRYQGKGGILPLTEVKDRVKADAAKAKAAKQAYELVADAVNKNKGGDLQAVAKALGAAVAVTPLFAAAQPPAVLAGEAQVLKKAFLLKEGELGGPVETAKGIYAIKIKERKPAAVPPLAQIRSQVEASARADKAKELAKKKAEEALAALGKGGAGLKLQETGSFSFSDKGEVPRIGLAPALQEAAFNLTTAAPVPKEPFKVGDTWYAIRLKNRIQANPADFEKNKAQIKQQLLPKKQQDALDAWVKELRAKAKIETNASLLTD